MTDDHNALRLASIGLWLASAGHARASCPKRHPGRQFGQRHLGSSRDGWATAKLSQLVERHDMPAHRRTAFFESP